MVMSNNRENAVKNLLEFIHSDEKVVLIKGTHQYEKHSLVLKLIHETDLKVGVFRSNSLQNIATFLDHAGYKVPLNKKFSSGNAYGTGKTTLYFDSLFTRSTWSKSPNQLDFAVVYPMDSFCEKSQKAKGELLEDLLTRKHIEKIFIVTWTDIRHDYDWLAEYVDRTVIYDAEEEDAAYHQRVIENATRRY
jgi:hypothetical protein